MLIEQLTINTYRPTQCSPSILRQLFTVDEDKANNVESNVFAEWLVPFWCNRAAKKRRASAEAGNDLVSGWHKCADIEKVWVWFIYKRKTAE